MQKGKKIRLPSKLYIAAFYSSSMKQVTWIQKKAAISLSSALNEGKKNRNYARDYNKS